MTSHLKKLKIQQLEQDYRWFRDCGYSWIFFFVYLFYIIFENGFYDNQNLKDNCMVIWKYNELTVYLRLFH